MRFFHLTDPGADCCRSLLPAGGAAAAGEGHATTLGVSVAIAVNARAAPSLVQRRKCRSVRIWFRFLLLCLQCFDALGWAAGRASGL